MPAATFGGEVFARILYQNLSHQPRRNGKEVFAICPSDLWPLREPQIRLVYQARALQRVIAALFAEVPPSQAVQFVVHQRYE